MEDISKLQKEQYQSGESNHYGTEISVLKNIDKEELISHIRAWFEDYNLFVYKINPTTLEAYGKDKKCCLRNSLP